MNAQGFISLGIFLLAAISGFKFKPAALLTSATGSPQEMDGLGKTYQFREGSAFDRRIEFLPWLETADRQSVEAMLQHPLPIDFRSEFRMACFQKLATADAVAAVKFSLVNFPVPNASSGLEDGVTWAAYYAPEKVHEMLALIQAQRESPLRSSLLCGLAMTSHPQRDALLKELCNAEALQQNHWIGTLYHRDPSAALQMAETGAGDQGVRAERYRALAAAVAEEDPQLALQLVLKCERLGSWGKGGPYRAIGTKDPELMLKLMIEDHSGSNSQFHDGLLSWTRFDPDAALTRLAQIKPLSRDHVETELPYTMSEFILKNPATAVSRWKDLKQASQVSSLETVFITTLARFQGLEAVKELIDALPPAEQETVSSQLEYGWFPKESEIRDWLKHPDTIPKRLILDQRFAEVLQKLPLAEQSSVLANLPLDRKIPLIPNQGAISPALIQNICAAVAKDRHGSVGPSTRQWYPELEGFVLRFVEMDAPAAAHWAEALDPLVIDRLWIDINVACMWAQQDTAAAVDWASSLADPHRREMVLSFLGVELCHQKLWREAADLLPQLKEESQIQRLKSSLEHAPKSSASR